MFELFALLWAVLVIFGGAWLGAAAINRSRGDRAWHWCHLCRCRIREPFMQHFDRTHAHLQNVREAS